MPIVSAKLKYVLLSVIFLLGYTSLSFELIVLRQLINFVGSNTLITSIVITFILLFLSVGYYLGSTIKMAHRPVRLMMLKFLKILTIWYVISCSYFMIQVYFLLAYMCTIKSSLGFVSLFSAVFLAFPSVCLGFITSVIGRIIHRHNEAYTCFLSKLHFPRLSLGSWSHRLRSEERPTKMNDPLLGVYT